MQRKTQFERGERKKIRIEQEKTGENTVKLGRIVRKTGSRGKGEKQNRKINEKEKKRYK